MFFNTEFYPTPEPTIDNMKLDCYGKVCYEPHAGSGNIVKWLQRNGAKQVIASEKHPQLRKILSGLCPLIAEDFFTVKAEDISHVQLIVMNPPFSNAERHIQHAWEIAPEGCEIVSLMNWATLDKMYSRDRLQILINDYGDTPENLGDCFSEAERKTGVEVALIRLFKPIVSKSFDYEGFFFEPDAEEKQQYGVMPYNEIRSIVNTYVAAVKCFDEFRNIGIKLNTLTKMVNYGDTFQFKASYNDAITTAEQFSKGMQKACWKHVFAKLHLQKIVTSGVMKDINEFIEARQKYPFTMRNIYRMLEIIIGTSENTMKRAIVEAIDQLTQYTDENRYGLPGWKTNAGHLLNQKFIVNNMVETNWSTPHLSYHSSTTDKINDLEKALCHVCGVNYDELPTVYQVFGIMGSKLTTNTWYSAGFFEFKYFKKGTMHFKFQDTKHWELLNRAYAKAKGQTLPEKL